MSTQQRPHLTVTHAFAVPTNPTNATPHNLPATSAFSLALPEPKPTQPAPKPLDPLSSKAEVKTTAEATGMYGPLLETMRQVRDRVNGELTQWKEWEDSEFGGVGLGGNSNGGKKKRKGKNVQEELEEEEEEEDDE